MLNLDFLFNKKIYGVNLLDNNSDHKVYLSSNDYNHKQNNEVTLNGTWKCIYNNNFDNEIFNYAKNQDISNLKDIEVPLSIELQGFAKPQYVNTQYPFDGYNDGKLGEMINVDNPTITYYKDIIINKTDFEKDIIINFKGFESALYLYINGDFVGYSENLYVDSLFDITQYLNVGKNRIMVVIFKYSTASWFLDQDFFRFTGFFRDVSLAYLPKFRIEDISIKTKISDFKNKKAVVHFDLKRNFNENFELIIKDIRKNKLIYKGQYNINNIEVTLEKVEFWSSENPYLYQLTIIYNDNYYETKFGIKEVKINNSILLYNNERLIINGVNRHEWNMHTGRYVSKNDMEFDALLFKENNINAVRTSHYPNASYWYDLCDEYGIYLLDEACIESHGSYGFADGYHYEYSLPGSNMDYSDYLLNRVIRMYERDKNHPSIFMYSLGNESSFGDVHVKLYESLKKKNPEILVHYEGPSGNMNYENVSDVYSRMYTKPKDVEEFIKVYNNKPYIHCEYAHAMGNSTGNIELYRNLIKKYKTYQGGFVWDYIDQGLLYNNRLLYGGDFLDKPNDHNFCCNGLIFADRNDAKYSPKLKEIKYHYQPINFKISEKLIIVTNNNLFIDTNNNCFKVIINKNGNKVYEKYLKLNISPKKSKKIDLEYDFNNYDEFVIQVQMMNDNGLVIARDEKTFGKFQEKYINNGTVKVVYGHYNIGVIGDDFSYLFTLNRNIDQLPGLISIKVKSEEYIASTVIPTLFRPNTDNDFGNKYAFENAELYSISKYLYADCHDVSYEMLNEGFKICFKYHYKTGFIDVNYLINNEGNMIVETVYDKDKQINNLSILGLRFAIPNYIDKVDYYGLGEVETYPDRKNCAFTGWYTQTPFVTPYIRPQECGNHEECRKIILNGKTSKLNIIYINEYYKFKFLPYTEFEIENSNHLHEFPHSDYNYLTISGYTRGVGGDDSWGAPVYRKYTIDGKKKLAYKFIICPGK